MITGQLEEQPLPHVLQQLYAQRFTGELVINARTGLVQVYFRDGYPVYVNLSEGADLLGKILVEMRVLSEQAHRRSLALPPGPGQRYGDVLLQLGLCDETQLKQGLRAQVRRKLHRLLQLAEGGYAAIPGEHQRGLQGGESLRAHPYRVIYHGVRSFSPERLRRLVQPLSGNAFRLSPEAPAETASRYGFTDDEGYCLELLRRGYWSLHELQEVAGSDPGLIQAVLYTLLVTQLLDVGPEGSQPMARAHITDLPQPPRQAPALELPALELQVPVPAPVPVPMPMPMIELPPPQRPASAPAAAPRPQQREEPRPSLKSPALSLELDPVWAGAPSGSSPPQPARAESRPPPEAAPARELVLSLDSSASTSRRTPPPREAPNQPAGAGAGARTGATGPLPAVPARTGTSATNIPALGRAPASPQKPGNRPVSFEEQALLRAEIENKAKVVEDETLFAVLGLPETADAQAVKAAFLQAAKKFHPDRIVAMGLSALKGHAEKVFRRVNEAHQVLTDSEKRGEYLAELNLKKQSGDKLTKEKELAVKAVNAELAFSRGTVYLRKRDYGSAAREFDEAVRLNPDEGEHLGYAAWSHFCAGELGAAEGAKELVKAIRMSQKVGRLHYFLGVLYKQDNLEDKAYQSFVKAKELDARIEEADSEIRLIAARRSKRGGKPGSSDSKTRPPAGGKPSTDSKGAGGDKGGGGEKKKMSFLDRLRQPIGKK